jgi:hypothetical protein
MTPDQAATVSAEMTKQRTQELAGDAAHHKLRKSCEKRAAEMHSLLWFVANRQSNPNAGFMDQVDQLLKEISDAQ